MKSGVGVGEGVGLGVFVGVSVGIIVGVLLGMGVTVAVGTAALVEQAETIIVKRQKLEIHVRKLGFFILCLHILIGLTKEIIRNSHANSKTRLKQKLYCQAGHGYVPPTKQSFCLSVGG
jgi:hypothetical protein